MKAKSKLVSKKTPNFVAKGGPASGAQGPRTPMGKGIVAVRNRMPKVK